MTEVLEKKLGAMAPADRAMADDVREALDREPHFVTNGGREIAIPAGLADLFEDLAAAAARGETVAIRIGEPVALTARQAANELGMSRTTLCKLMDRGEIAGTRVGTHRRIPAAEVERYRSVRGRAAAAGYEAAIAGLDDVEDEVMTKLPGRAPKRPDR